MPHQKDVPQHLQTLSELVLAEVDRANISDELRPGLIMELLAVIRRFSLASKRGATRPNRDLQHHQFHSDVVDKETVVVSTEQHKQPPPPAPVVPATVLQQPHVAPEAPTLQPMTPQQQQQLLQQLLAERQGRVTPAPAPAAAPSALPQLPYDPNLSFNLGSMSSLNSFPPISSSPARSREMTTSSVVATA